MRRTRSCFAWSLILAAATLAPGQDEAAVETVAAASAIDGILQLIGLPTVAERTRDAGVSVEDVRIILEETRRHELRPQETTALLEETGVAARENGPVDNFGAFVQARLSEGLRGRDLAAAIRSEHAAHGKSKGSGKADLKGQGRGKQPEQAVEGEEEEEEQEHGRQDQDKKKGKGNG